MTDRTIAIRDVAASPGEKAFGFLEIAERPGSSVHMPLGIVNGRESGPTLCLTAGKHAVEYCGIDAVIRIFRETDPDELHGALLLVPVVNVPSFDTQTPFVCSVDNKDVAYLLPGNRVGSMSHRIAYTLVEEIIERSDCYIDLHGGDLPEWIVPWAIFMVTGDRTLDSKAEVLARLYGAEFIEKTSRPIMKIRKQIPAFVGEAGGLGRYDESEIAVHVRGVRNIMKYLEMLEGQPTMPGKQKMFTTRAPEQALDSIESAGFEILHTNRGGILFPKVKPGDTVRTGQELGDIVNLKGEVVEQIRAQTECAIIMIYPKHVVNAGDPVFSTVSVTELPPLQLP